MSRVGWVGLAVVVACVGTPASATADRSERLDQLRTEIEQRESRAQAYREEAEGYLGELEAIDQDLNETRRSVKRLGARRHEARKELSAANAALERAEVDRSRTLRELEQRLVALYKSQSAAGIPVLYSAGDVQEFARRRDALARVLDHDQALFRRHREAEERWREARDSTRELSEELRLATAEVVRREDRIRRSLVERRNLVALLHSRSDREQRAAAELRLAAERLAETLGSLPDDLRAGPAGSGLVRGQVSRPASGNVRLGFGRQVDSEFGTETVRNGIEFAAEPGAPVAAVAAGRVLFAGAFRGYGQLVIVDHGAGHVSVSGHLDELAVEAGESVSGGQSVGRVGETGPLGRPGLYFEIRVDGAPVDPEDWLRR